MGEQGRRTASVLGRHGRQKVWRWRQRLALLWRERDVKRYIRTVVAVAGVALVIWWCTVFVSSRGKSEELRYPVRAGGAEYHAYVAGIGGQVREENWTTIAGEGDARMVLPLDCWERMVNVESALRRLVQIGVEADFTVVEPLMYESRVSREYAFESMFERRGIVAQTAALYYQTAPLHRTGRYIPRREFQRRVAVGGRGELHIEAAVYFDWGESKPKKASFDWCTGVLGAVGALRRVWWRLRFNVHVQRILCVSPGALRDPFSHQFFDDVFKFVKAGTRRVGKPCARCVTLALVNYRKHAFSAYVARNGQVVTSTPSTRMMVGKVPLFLAEKVGNEALGGKPYVAVQMRTGKPYTLFQQHEKSVGRRKGARAAHELFRNWLHTCTGVVINKAKEVAGELGPDVRFYVASDMYNEGWKHGEEATWVVQRALHDAKERLQRELNPLVWLQPEVLALKQDEMGMSGLVDAAVCVRAHGLVYAKPSNFGSWVHSQRSMMDGSVSNSTYAVDCQHEIFRE